MRVPHSAPRVRGAVPRVWAVPRAARPTATTFSWARAPDGAASQRHAYYDIVPIGRASGAGEADGLAPPPGWPPSALPGGCAQAVIASAKRKRRAMIGDLGQPFCSQKTEMAARSAAPAIAANFTFGFFVLHVDCSFGLACII